MTDEPRSVSTEERDWGTMAHLSALSGILLPIGFLAGPLLVWFLHRREHGFVRQHARAATEFQVTMLLVGVLAVYLMWLDFRFVALVLAVVLADVVLACLGAARASRGEPYSYPMAIPFLGSRKAVRSHS